MMAGLRGFKIDRHEVDDLSHALFGKKPGDENVRVRPVVLLVRGFIAVGCNFAPPAFAIVQDGAEHAWRIEVGKTEPVDRAVHTNQRTGSHVADQAVLFNWEVRHTLLLRRIPLMIRWIH